MAKHAQNKLIIRVLEDGRFFLSGRIDVKQPNQTFKRIQVRRWFSLEEGELAKATQEQLLSDAEAFRRGLKEALRFAPSRLTHEQQLDAEAAVLELPAGRTLAYCVRSVNMAQGDGAPVKCVDAMKAYEKDLIQRRKSDVHRKDCIRRITRFLNATKFGLLSEINSAKTKDYALRADLSAIAQVNEANHILMWLNFCVREKFLKESPFNIDLTQLREGARPETEPEILLPIQCQRLLNSAAHMYDGKLLPYVVLGLWGFIRPDEVKRLKPSNFIMHNGNLTIDHRGNKFGSEWRHTIIPPNVAPVLLKQIKAGAITDGGGVFFSVRKFMRIRADAGLLELEGTDVKGGMPTIKEGSSDWCNDILRHTGMSYLFQQIYSGHLAKGMAPNIASDLATKEVTTQAGNSKKVAFRHYLRRVSDSAFKEFFAIKPSAAPTQRVEADIIDINSKVA